jgi:hypothetical protein
MSIPGSLDTPIDVSGRLTSEINQQDTGSSVSSLNPLNRPEVSSIARHPDRLESETNQSQQSGEESCCFSTLMYSAVCWMVFLVTFGLCDLFPRPLPDQTQNPPDSTDVGDGSPQTTLPDSTGLDSIEVPIQPTEIPLPEGVLEKDIAILRLINFLKAKGIPALQEKKIFSGRDPAFEPVKAFVDEFKDDPRKEISQDADLQLVAYGCMRIMYFRKPACIPPEVYGQLALAGRNQASGVPIESEVLKTIIQGLGHAERYLLQQIIFLFGDVASDNAQLDRIIDKYAPAIIGDPPQVRYRNTQGNSFISQAPAREAEEDRAKVKELLKVIAERREELFSDVS